MTATTAHSPTLSFPRPHPNVFCVCLTSLLWLDGERFLLGSDVTTPIPQDCLYLYPLCHHSLLSLPFPPLHTAQILCLFLGICIKLPCKEEILHSRTVMGNMESEDMVLCHVFQVTWVYRSCCVWSGAFGQVTPAHLKNVTLDCG